MIVATTPSNVRCNLVLITWWGKFGWVATDMFCFLQIMFDTMCWWHKTHRLNPVTKNLEKLQKWSANPMIVSWSANTPEQHLNNTCPQMSNTTWTFLQKLKNCSRGLCKVVRYNGSEHISWNRFRESCSQATNFCASQKQWSKVDILLACMKSEWFECKGMQR